MWREDIDETENALEIDTKAEKVAPLNEDFVFEIDRIVNVHDKKKGLTTTIDDERQLADEKGPEWDQKLKRIQRRLRDAERQPQRLKEDRTERFAIECSLFLRFLDASLKDVGTQILQKNVNCAAKSY